MTETLHLPVLSLDDQVVLPGMVVPIELDDAAKAAVDAASASADGRLLLSPRLEDRYATHGVVATIEQIGRLPGGRPGAVLRAEARARIGVGVTGPGAALWVEAEPIENEAPSDRAVELAAEYKARSSRRQRRNAWQIIDPSSRSPTRPRGRLSGWAAYRTVSRSGVCWRPRTSKSGCPC